MRHKFTRHDRCFIMFIIVPRHILFDCSSSFDRMVRYYITPLGSCLILRRLVLKGTFRLVQIWFARNGINSCFIVGLFLCKNDKCLCNLHVKGLFLSCLLDLVVLLLLLIWRIFIIDRTFCLGFETRGFIHSSWFILIIFLLAYCVILAWSLDCLSKIPLDCYFSLRSNRRWLFLLILWFCILTHRTFLSCCKRYHRVSAQINLASCYSWR